MAKFIPRGKDIHTQVLSLDMLRCSVSIQLFTTPWTVACQAPLSWSEVPFPPPGDLPDPGIKPVPLLSCLLHWQEDYLPLEPPGKHPIPG